MRKESDGAARQSGPSAATGGPATQAERTIIIEDEALRRGFTQLPNYLFQVRGLSHSAKLTYALILSYAWQKDYCFPGQDTLARDLEVSTRSVIEYLKELQAHGLIRIQRRGLGLTNVYHVLRYPPAPTSDPDLKPASDQGLKQAAPLDTQASSALEVYPPAPLHVRRASPDKNPAPTRPTQKETAQQYTPEQKPVAAPRQGQKAPSRVRPGAVLPGAPAVAATRLAQEMAGTRLAMAALRAHGVHNRRLLTELTAEPDVVLAQIERLQALEPGAVANPAGWLVEAIRGRYGSMGQGSLPGGTTASAVPAAGSPAALSVEAVGEGVERSTTIDAGAWAAVCAELRAELTPENYRRWFVPTAALACADNHLTVGVPDPFHLQWLDRRLRGAIERAAARVLGTATIEFVVVGQASA